ncbi:hypothetical protein SAMN06269185_3130 [Natronoarchaeum philippinense]|uniref:Uncharacterized protein n=1 Tax=Natronoarchaeum philippinense TaxID=558529 RepID=A0A285P8Q5_NATPI|nr:hypothetical protein [Natronoarchaeum philippinense]SNZ17808.1 hypothetical protein SAMN06269185_3130 [Natronoarchaeum philippinense]
MSDADVPSTRADPRVIRRLNVIIVLLVLPYVLFALGLSRGVLVQLVGAGVLVLAAVSVWYAIVPSRS